MRSDLLLMLILLLTLLQLNLFEQILELVDQLISFLQLVLMVTLLLKDKSGHLLNFLLIVRNLLSLNSHDLVRVSDFDLDLLLVLNTFILSFNNLKLPMYLFLHLIGITELNPQLGKFKLSALKLTIDPFIFLS